MLHVRLKDLHIGFCFFRENRPLHDIHALHFLPIIIHLLSIGIYKCVCIHIYYTHTRMYVYACQHVNGYTCQGCLVVIFCTIKLNLIWVLFTFIYISIYIHMYMYKYKSQGLWIEVQQVKQREEEFIIWKVFNKSEPPSPKINK